MKQQGTLTSMKTTNLYSLIPRLDLLAIKKVLGFLYMFIFCQNAIQQ